MTAAVVLCTAAVVGVGWLWRRRQRRTRSDLDWAARARPAALRRWGEIVQPGIDAAKQRNNRGDETRTD